MLESLQSLACADPPIVDPVSRTVVGILDITCGVDDVTDLVGPLIVSAVRDVKERLLAQSATSEQVLLREYLRSKRRGNQAVVAMSGDTVIATPTASRLMDSTDTMIWDWIHPRQSAGSLTWLALATTSSRPADHGASAERTTMVAGSKDTMSCTRTLLNPPISA